MRLDEIKPLTESSTPIHLTMLLNEIIKAGKVTNTAQYLVLQQVVQLYKFVPAGAAVRMSDMAKFGTDVSARYINENPSSKEVLDQLKALTGEEQVKLSEWCLFQLANTEAHEDMARYCNPGMEMNKWVAWVNQKQD